MIDTTEIRRLLSNATIKPSQKNVSKLAVLVSELCNEYDKEPGVMDIIEKNQHSIETTFSFIKSLQEK